MKNTRSVGILLSYGYTFLNMLCGLFLSSFLLKVLGDSEYGLYQTVSAFATYLVLLEFGTGTVMSRNILKYRNAKNEEQVKKSISTVWYITAVLSLVIAAAAVVFYLNMGSIYSKTMTAEQVAYGKKIFLLVAVHLLASFYTQCANGILMGYENYTFGNYVRVVRLFLRTLLIVALLIWGHYAVFVALIDMLLSLSMLLVTVLYCKTKYRLTFHIKEFDTGILKESLPLCLALMLQSIVNQANNNVDKFIIGIQLSMESVAIYSVAQYIYSMFSSITTIPISMYLPQVAKNLSKDMGEKAFTKTLVQPCRLIVLLGGMVVGGFFAVGKQFITLIYGSDKIETWTYALIIMIPMFVNMSNGIIVNVLDMMNKRLVRSCTLIGTTVLNVLLTVYFVSAYGIIGAVVATAVATLLGQIILMNIYYAKKLRIKVLYLFYQSYKGILPITIAAALVSFFVARAIGHTLVSFLAGGLLFVAVCFVGMLFLGMNEYEKKACKKMLARWRKEKAK